MACNVTWANETVCYLPPEGVVGNATDIIDLFKYANHVLGEGKFFGTSMAMVVWMVLFMGILPRVGNNPAKALMASGTVAMLFGLVLSVVEVTGPLGFVLPAVGVIGGAVLDKLQRRDVF